MIWSEPLSSGYLAIHGEAITQRALFTDSTKHPARDLCSPRESLSSGSTQSSSCAISQPLRTSACCSTPPPRVTTHPTAARGLPATGPDPLAAQHKPVPAAAIRSNADLGQNVLLCVWICMSAFSSECQENTESALDKQANHLREICSYCATVREAVLERGSRVQGLRSRLL